MKLRNDLAMKKKKQAVTIKAIQFPIVSNNTTTGWKLQGLSVQNLYIKEWNISCKNWIYVPPVYLPRRILLDPKTKFWKQRQRSSN